MHTNTCKHIHSGAEVSIYSFSNKGFHVVKNKHYAQNLRSQTSMSNTCMLIGVHGLYPNHHRKPMTDLKIYELFWSRAQNLWAFLGGNLNLWNESSESTKPVLRRLSRHLRRRAQIPTTYSACRGVCLVRSTLHHLWQDRGFSRISSKVLVVVCA